MFAYSRLGFHPRTPRMPPAAPLRAAKQDKEQQQHGLQDRSCRSSVGHLGGEQQLVVSTRRALPGWMGMEERMGAKCSARPKQQHKTAACLMGLCGSGPHGKETIRTSGIPIICPVGAETVPETDGPRRQ